MRFSMRCKLFTSSHSYTSLSFYKCATRDSFKVFSCVLQDSRRWYTIILSAEAYQLLTHKAWVNTTNGVNNQNIVFILHSLQTKL